MTSWFTGTWLRARRCPLRPQPHRHLLQVCQNHRTAAFYRSSLWKCFNFLWMLFLSSLYVALLPTSMPNNWASNKMLNASDTVGSCFTFTSHSLVLKESDKSPTKPKIWAQLAGVATLSVWLPRHCSMTAHDCRLSPIIFTFHFLFFFIFPRDL